MAAPIDASGFYFDPEILGGGPPTLSHDPPPLAADLVEYLRAASAPSQLSSSTSEVGGASWLSTPPRSLPDITAAPEEGGGPSPEASVVRSEQVGAFWERYRAYPKYLKNVTKRKKRRDRKGREEAPIL
jgi:hypothetical protein